MELIIMDNNLATLKDQFETKYSQAIKLKTDPDNPQFKLLKSELRVIQDKIYNIIRG
jgi:hypothetical protein